MKNIENLYFSSRWQGVTTVWLVSHMLLTVVAGDIAYKINYAVVCVHMRLTANRILNDYLKIERLMPNKLTYCRWVNRNKVSSNKESMLYMISKWLPKLVQLATHAVWF